MIKRTTICGISFLFHFAIVTYSCDSFKLEHFVDEETKTYCYFKDGIQYVFVDFVTGNVDTLFMNEKWYVATHGTPKINGQIISSRSATGIDVENSTMNITCETLDPFDSSAESYSWAEFKGEGWGFIAFYISNNNELPGFSPHFILELLETFSTYESEGDTYYDVKKVRLEHVDSSEYSYSYWAKNVGLIKYQRFSEDSILNNICLRHYEIPY